MIQRNEYIPEATAKTARRLNTIYHWVEVHGVRADLIAFETRKSFIVVR